MDRRSFIRSAAGSLAVLLLAPSVPAGTYPFGRTSSRLTPRYRIHGNKKLGCSGFDFPDDPDIIDNGLFMPSL